MPELDVEISGSGKPLVFIHSLLQDRSSFHETAQRLSGQRKVCNVNMPGFGASTAADHPEGMLAGFADTIADGLDKLGIGADADICGNGLGGFVGLTLAIRHGARFDRLVLVGSAIRFPEAGRQVFRAMADKAEAEGMDPLADQAMLRMFPQSYIDAIPQRIAALKKVFIAINPVVFAAACRELARLDLADDLNHVRNPVLVVVGENDSATRATLGRALAAALPDGEIRILKNAAHAPHMQEPEKFLAEIAPFLRLNY